jgi:hypothetical protein
MQKSMATENLPTAPDSPLDARLVACPHLPKFDAGSKPPCQIPQQ